MKTADIRQLALAGCVILGTAMVSGGAWAQTLPIGSPCTANSQCQSGYCNMTNGVANAACDGAQFNPVPELPEILMPALLVGAGAVAYRARKKAMKKKARK